MKAILAYYPQLQAILKGLSGGYSIMYSQFNPHQACIIYYVYFSVSEEFL